MHWPSTLDRATMFPFLPEQMSSLCITYMAITGNLTPKGSLSRATPTCNQTLGYFDTCIMGISRADLTHYSSSFRWEPQTVKSPDKSWQVPWVSAISSLGPAY